VLRSFGGALARGFDPACPGSNSAQARRRTERSTQDHVHHRLCAVALHPSSHAPKQAKVLSKPFHLREIVAEVDRMMPPDGRSPLHRFFQYCGGRATIAPVRRRNRRAI